MPYTDTGIPGEQIFGGMSRIHLFPYYQTREDYTKQTGKPCPEFNPMRQVKHWEDPGALDRTGGNPVISYRVIAIHPATRNIMIDGNGKPYLEDMTITTVEAMSVNIPPQRAGPPDVIDPKTGKTYNTEVRMPVRELHHDEEWVLGGFAGGVSVRPTPAPKQPHDMVMDRIGELEDKLLPVLVGLKEELGRLMRSTVLLSSHVKALNSDTEGGGEEVGAGGDKTPRQTNTK